MHIWKGTNDGREWSVIYTFSCGAIEHVHAVQYDKYGDKIWLATGDTDAESRIMYSTDNCKTFKTIGEGSQEWRAVSLLFTEKYVYWGMDSPYSQNYIFRWDRNTAKKEAVARIDGPAYFSTELNDRTLVLATTVEYGMGEWDKNARVWIKRAGMQIWEDVGKWKRLPGVRTHGLLKFAHPNKSSFLYVSPYNTVGHYSLIKIKLEEK